MTGGGPFSPTIPLDGFKRIEVVRSPGSVVYGADVISKTKVDLTIFDGKLVYKRE